VGVTGTGHDTMIFCDSRDTKYIYRNERLNSRGEFREVSDSPSLNDFTTRYAVPAVRATQVARLPCDLRSPAVGPFEKSGSPGFLHF
jgi:hypothetical protein